MVSAHISSLPSLRGHCPGTRVPPAMTSSHSVSVFLVFSPPMACQLVQLDDVYHLAATKRAVDQLRDLDLVLFPGREGSGSLCVGTAAG